MTTVDERVVRLESRGAEHQRMFTAMRDTVDHLEQRMDRRFDQVDHRLAAIERDVSNNFRWIVGIQLTTLIAIIAALIGK